MEAISPTGREAIELTEGWFLTLMGVGERMSVQHFRVDPGSGVPEHSHEHEEIVHPTEGS